MVAGGSGSLVAAALWIEQTLLGTVATVVAVICVAVVGLMMLGGRVDFRRAATVVMGCFIIFGARNVAAGIAGTAAGGSGYSDVPATTFTSPPPASVAAPPPNAAPPADPFAGAAVPTR